MPYGGVRFHPNSRRADVTGRAPVNEIIVGGFQEI
jgi:hypothetical protein